MGWRYSFIEGDVVVGLLPCFSEGEEVQAVGGDEVMDEQFFVGEGADVEETKEGCGGGVTGVGWVGVSGLDLMEIV